ERARIAVAAEDGDLVIEAVLSAVGAPLQAVSTTFPAEAPVLSVADDETLVAWIYRQSELVDSGGRALDAATLAGLRVTTPDSRSSSDAGRCGRCAFETTHAPQV